MNIIQVNNVTGTPPYSIYICDLTLTTCYLLSEILTTIPPTIEDPIPAQFEGLNPLILKIVDGAGCETFQVIDCTISQTPTPTFTPTPTVTPSITPTVTPTSNTPTLS